MCFHINLSLLFFYVPAIVVILKAFLSLSLFIMGVFVSNLQKDQGPAQGLFCDKKQMALYFPLVVIFFLFYEWLFPQRQFQCDALM